VSEASQRAYLEAMEIPVWIRKELAERAPDFVPPGLMLGPGSSQVLFICSRIDEPAKRISADIVRTLKSEPVWAWPVASEDAPDLKTTVADRLFTTVLVLGESLAKDMFNQELPETLGSARILQAASLQELEMSPKLKRELWNLVNSNHLIG